MREGDETILVNNCEGTKIRDSYYTLEYFDQPEFLFALTNSERDSIPIDFHQF